MTAVGETAGTSSPARLPLFDFDGTLVDSDAALLAPYAALGIAAADRPPLGLPLGEACARAGVTVRAYLDLYDSTAVAPFAGVVDVLARLDRWGLASNKDRDSGLKELARLGWSPTVALFSDDFGGRPKRLGPLLAALGLEADGAIYVGDTEHDRHCAGEAGVDFALAGWNPRCVAAPGDVVLGTPNDLLELLD